MFISTSDDYIIKTTQVIKDTMTRSPTEHVIKTIEYLNINNAILNKTNAQLVVTARTRQSKKDKRTLDKARLLSKEAADVKRAEAETKETADIAHKVVIGQKKKEQMLKKTKEEADKTERAIQYAAAKDAREINAEMSRLAKIKQRLFT